MKSVDEQLQEWLGPVIYGDKAKPERREAHIRTLGRVGARAAWVRVRCSCLEGTGQVLRDRGLPLTAAVEFFLQATDGKLSPARRSITEIEPHLSYTPPVVVVFGRADEPNWSDSAFERLPSSIWPSARVSG